VGILGRTDGSDEFAEVSAIEIGTIVEMVDAGRIPHARYQAAGPECGLGILSARDVGEDVGDYLGGEKDFSAGLRGSNRR
jgi:hypothetical protein